MVTLSPPNLRILCGLKYYYPPKAVFYLNRGNTDVGIFCYGTTYLCVLVKLVCEN